MPLKGGTFTKMFKMKSQGPTRLLESDWSCTWQKARKRVALNHFGTPDALLGG